MRKSVEEIDRKIDYDLIICDIDGCLTPEEPLPMDLGRLRTIAGYNRLAQDVKDRPLLTLCSGRPQPFAEAMCRFLQNTSAPCIAENGVWLYHPGNNEYYLDPGITIEHLDIVHQASSWFRKKMARKGITIQPGKTASISLYHQSHEYLESLLPDVEKTCKENGWPFRVSMSWYYINCDLEHISKGTAIDRLLTMLGLDRDRIAGIGDTQGDIFIAERVSYFAAPSNCDERIRRIANYVSPYPETAGILDILKKLTGLEALDE